MDTQAFLEIPGGDVTKHVRIYEEWFMLSRSAKNAFYKIAGPLMRLNGWRYRYITHAIKQDTGPVLVHLGPGQKKYLKGWINIDANMFTGKCDIWADLRNPLPFGEGTVDAIYSHHMIEHLPDIEGHLKDAYRVLKKGGVYRVGGPNGDSAIKKFVENDSDWFSDWPDKYNSIGGRFVNYILCRNEHLTILTESFLMELGKRAGFTSSVSMLPVKDTNYPEYFSDCLEIEHEDNFHTPHTLVIEFTK